MLTGCAPKGLGGRGRRGLGDWLCEVGVLEPGMQRGDEGHGTGAGSPGLDSQLHPCAIV